MSFTEPNSNKWTVYTKSGCPYCTKAKDLLNQNRFYYDLVDCDKYLSDDKTKEEFLAYIESKAGTKHRTFPMIFKNGLFIGGFDKTTEYINNLNSTNCLRLIDDF